MRDRCAGFMVDGDAFTGDVRGVDEGGDKLPGQLLAHVGANVGRAESFRSFDQAMTPGLPEGGEVVEDAAAGVVVVVKAADEFTQGALLFRRE